MTFEKTIQSGVGRQDLLIALAVMLVTGPFLLCAGPVWGQNSPDIELVGRWGGGPCKSVAVDAGVTYLVDGAQLELLDFADPAAPVVLGRVGIPWIGWKVAVSGNLAFVACDEGLAVIDVSDTGQPYLAGTLEAAAYHAVESVAASGEYAYVLEDNGIRVVDVSDPLHPTGVNFLPVFHTRAVLAVAGDHLYVAYNAEFAVFDLTDPAAPVQVGYTYSGAYLPMGLVVAGNHAYLVFDGGLRVIDVTDPKAPATNGLYETNTLIYDVAVAENFAYLVDYFGDMLRLVDVSDPFDPIPRTNYVTSYEQRAVAIDGTTAYLAADNDGLHVLNIGNSPAPPVEVGFYEPVIGARHLVLSGQDLFLWNNRVSALDVSDPRSPRQISELNVRGTPRGLDIWGTDLYLAAGASGVQVIDISDPTALHEVGSLNSDDFIFSVAGNGHHVYAGGDDGLHVIDISGPDGPVELMFLDIGLVRSVAVSGDYLYVGSVGLNIFDITDPANPVAVGTAPVDNYSKDILVEGDLAYVAASHNGLRIVDVSDPAAPVELGFRDVPGDMNAVAVVGHNAFVANGDAGLLALDVSDPTDPVVIGSHATASYAQDVAAAGTHVYVADFDGGLYVFDVTGLMIATEAPVWNVTDPTVQNYPNPFNPTTVIELQLPTATAADLSVYDLAGRRLVTLLHGHVEAGRRRVTWNGRDNDGRLLPSGVYLYRLQAGQRVVSRRMHLVR